MSVFERENSRLTNFWNNRYLKFSLAESGIRSLPKDGNNYLYQCKTQALIKALQYIGLSKISVISILDAGCGQGYFGKVLAKLLPKSTYLGIDISQKLIKYLKKYFPKQKWIAADFATSSFVLKERFDLIQTIETLHLIIEDKVQYQALRNLTTLLKPGGYIIFTDTLPKTREKIKDYIVFRPLDYYKNILQRLDVEIELIFPIYYFFPSLSQKIRYFPPKLIYFLDRVFFKLKIPQFSFGHDSLMKVIIGRKLLKYD